MVQYEKTGGHRGRFSKSRAIAKKFGNFEAAEVSKAAKAIHAPAPEATQETSTDGRFLKHPRDNNAITKRAYVGFSLLLLKTYRNFMFL
ncbi:MULTISPECIES: hypothetical protein [unclassified Pseudomonas]|uniref:hypothetical protein n=1 Tax=unclassified Pseudomonas TaxID=196821 RepID=UPI002AC9946C|nr:MULTISPECIES: hypothetical protein [unclassified Pseudomonas]MEB0045919.1 hypothetical protein [Pseudomonas sp. Dout3]MEB0097179.1 hypothetical protein [Pseudomonas sp. DC1.2]WPX56883.1 hypothetical protein RHM68_14560 [Pseudomonas sp. DC1.2]